MKSLFLNVLVGLLGVVLAGCGGEKKAAADPRGDWTRVDSEGAAWFLTLEGGALGGTFTRMSTKGEEIKQVRGKWRRTEMEGKKGKKALVSPDFYLTFEYAVEGMDEVPAGVAVEKQEAPPDPSGLPSLPSLLAKESWQVKAPVDPKTGEESMTLYLIEKPSTQDFKPVTQAYTRPPKAMK